MHLLDSINKLILRRIDFTIEIATDANGWMMMGERKELKARHFKSFRAENLAICPSLEFQWERADGCWNESYTKDV